VTPQIIIVCEMASRPRADHHVVSHVLLITWCHYAYDYILKPIEAMSFCDNNQAMCLGYDLCFCGNNPFVFDSVYVLGALFLYCNAKATCPEYMIWFWDRNKPYGIVLFYACTVVSYFFVVASTFYLGYIPCLCGKKTNFFLNSF
jgi:hypothetical protein